MEAALEAERRKTREREEEAFTIDNVRVASTVLIKALYCSFGILDEPA
jgi:hypothetical protein